MTDGEHQQPSAAELARKAEYFRGRCEELAASLLHADATTSVLRHELEQKRRGIALLAGIMDALGPADEFETLRTASLRINPTLNMQRTAVLMPVGDGFFRASILRGYERDEADRIAAYGLQLPPGLAGADAPRVVTKASGAGELAPLCDWLALPYLIAAPVTVEGDLAAVIVTGRLRERHPFMPRLGQGEADTIQTIAAFVGAIMGQKRLAEVEHLANHDALTGLPNLRLGHERLLQAIANARRRESAVALLYIDLDGFKAVNDTFGHKAGDTVLREIGRRMQEAVREVDTVARIGGDEFIVVLTDMTVTARPSRVAEELLAVIGRPVNWRGNPVRLGGSIGLALFPDDGESADELLSVADRAMYSVKHDGKNAFRLAGGRIRPGESPGSDQRRGS